MKSLFVGLLVGLAALGFTFVFDIEVNLANYLLGYAAGVVAMLIISPTQRAADGVNRAPENLIPPDKVPPAPPRVKSPRR